METNIMKMLVTPVRKYPTPRFPTISDIHEHPELLKRIPKRWRTKPLVAAALAGSALFLPGCTAQEFWDWYLEHMPPSGLVEMPYFLSEAEVGDAINLKSNAPKEGREAGAQIASAELTNAEIRQQLVDYIQWLQGQGIA
jgi:hypothetical protein